jgi:hypothetical protein
MWSKIQDGYGDEEEYQNMTSRVGSRKISLGMVERDKDGI